jgi:hypothetical protein
VIHIQLPPTTAEHLDILFRSTDDPKLRQVAGAATQVEDGFAGAGCEQVDEVGPVPPEEGVPVVVQPRVPHAVVVRSPSPGKASGDGGSRRVDGRGEQVMWRWNVETEKWLSAILGGVQAFGRPKRSNTRSRKFLKLTMPQARHRMAWSPWLNPSVRPLLLRFPK